MFLERFRSSIALLRPQRPVYPIAALFVIGSGTLFLFWPILSGKVLFSGAQILYHYIYFSMMQHWVYGLGMLPDWWPAYNSGYPVSLTLDGFLNPVFILALKYLSPFFANNLLTVIFFILNGFSFYLFARAIKLSWTGSMVAAIGYAFSGVVVEYSTVIGILTLMPFLPLSFLCCLKIFEGKKKWFWPWLALLLYSWIGGWSEMIVYALVAVGIFALYLFVKKRLESGHFSYREPALFFGAIILSVLILAPWFLSIAYFVSHSSRSGGTNIEAAASAPTTISHLLYMIYPRLSVFNGDLLPFLRLNGEGLFFYIGMLPLLLVLAGFFIRNKKEKGYLIFFMSLAAGAILMTIEHSPLFWLFHQMPVLQWFNGYWKWSFVVVFSLAILAGFGMDHIKDFFSNRFSKRIIIALWIAMLMALSGISAATLFDQKIKSAIVTYGTAHYKTTADRAFNRSDQHYRDVITEMADSLVDNFSFKNAPALLTAILWFLTLAYLTAGALKIGPHQRWRSLAIPVTLLGSTLIWIGFLNGPPTSYLKDAPSTARYLHSIEPYRSDSLPLGAETAEALTPYRIYLYAPDQYLAVLSEKYGINLARGENNQRTQLSYELMEDNAHLNFNFDTFQNHQTLTLQRLQTMGSLVERQQPITKAEYLNKTPFENYVGAFSDKNNFKLMGALNIKYILSPIELAGGLSPIFTARVINGAVPVHVYKNPYFMPRWYFADTIKWTEADDEVAIRDLQTIGDFQKTTLLETLTNNDPAIRTQPDTNDNFEVGLYAPGTLRLKTTTKNYRFLVFSESRVPFWQASVNGVPAPLYTANYLYQAVLVPPGENIVEFRYPNLWERAALSLRSLVSL